VPRAEAQLIITGTHTIEVDEGEEETINGPVSGNAQAVLNIIGAGRANLSIGSDNFLGRFIVRGAELRLHKEGRAYRASYVITNGGVLFMDKVNDQMPFDYLHNTEVSMSLFSGSIKFTTKQGETWGALSLLGGANTIDIQRSDAHLYANLGANVSFFHNGTATLNQIGNRDYSSGVSNETIQFHYTTSSPDYAIGGIIPWSTVNGSNWSRSVVNGNFYFLVSFTNYATDTQWTWGTSHNVSLGGNDMLTDDRTINSLRIVNSGSLNLVGYTLTIDSGGLLSTGADDLIKGIGNVVTNRPLFLHVYGNRLRIEDKASFKGNIHLIKTGQGALELDSDATHEFAGVTINQGIIRLLKGFFSLTGIITVGDSAGIDMFEIGPNLDNPIVKTSGGFPEMTLRGNPYGPSTDAAILRFNGNTRQQLAKLHIQDRGMIDFIGANKAAPNILYLDQLTFSDANARLTIRNWNDQADYLLVRKIWGDANVPAILSRIYFEGYGPAKWHWHDLGSGYGDYWQITPFPEPSTYGAILGAIGMGLWIWRKQRGRRSAWDKV